MKFSGNEPEPKIFKRIRWKAAEQSPEDSSSSGACKAEPADTRAERKARMKLEIQRIRKKNDLERTRKRLEKRNTRAALARISTPQKRKAFLAARKEQANAAAQARRAEALRRRREIAAMPPEEKKKARREEKYQRRLRRRASRAYIPVLGVISAIAAAVLVYAGLIAYGIFVDNSYAFQNTGQALLYPTPHSSGETEASSSDDPYSLLLSQADLDFMKDRANILIMGIDNSDERNDPGSFDRTDTMLLLSVDFKTNNAYIISLPRDSYVRIYNKDYHNRINTAFGAGGGLNGDGFEYAMKTVSLLMGGIPVNNYICFDMDVVMDVVDAMDGIDFDVDVSFSLDGRTLNKGFQHLCGQQVLDYCRVREKITGGTDIARTARQRKMIMAIFSYMKQNGRLQDIPAIYSAVSKNIYTDLTFEQIASLAAFALKLDTDSIHDYLLPGKYLNEFEGASFWGIDQSKKQEMIYEIFGQTIQIDNSDDADTLLALQDQKNQAIAAGKKAISDADAYIAEFSLYVTSDQKSHYNKLKKTLEDAMSEKNPHDIRPTIAPITSAADALSDWVENTLKPAVQAAIDAAPTPTPDPGPSETPDPSPDEPSASASGLG